jgi:hypothetical protein
MPAYEVVLDAWGLTGSVAPFLAANGEDGACRLRMQQPMRICFPDLCLLQLGKGNGLIVGSDVPLLGAYS